ncbi:hypothetical protein JXD20_03200 [Candidatus Peregrinibacteria bacterium]|nr:hypothetical protein [Candidatus Peregrinibacteria bacterium]
MKNPLCYVSKYLILMLVSIFLLSACGDKLEDPETVIHKAKEAVTDIASGRVEVSADAEGQNGTDDLLFEGSMNLIFDHEDEENKKMDMHVALSGDMKTAEKQLQGDVDFEFVTTDGEYYVKLNELSSTDESLAPMQPFIDMYKSKWLKIAKDFIPENIRELQEEDEATKLKKEQLEDLFVETALFNVIKEYGIEKINGEKVYHYGIKPNMEGFKDYMVKAAIIDGREMTAQEVEEAVKVLAYIKDAELYIDADDYYILKAILVFSGAALNEEADASLEVKVVIEGSDYNKTVTVKAPEGAEDFNPLVLMMGFGGVPTVSEDAAMEEVEGTEEMEATDNTEELMEETAEE